MFSYYGSKSKIVDCYPKPKFDKIIEPFAGSARYSLKWFDRDVLLVDKYEVIVNTWKWLQGCSPNDIKKLPVMKLGETLDETVAYHRDNGEDLKKNTFTNVPTLFEDGFTGIDYIYCSLKDGRLLVSDGGPVIDLVVAIEEGL